MTGRLGRLCGTAALAATLLVAAAGPGTGRVRAAAGGLHHVIVISFDNTHLADIERMPALYGYLKAYGTIFPSDHTAVDAFTHLDFTTELTGLFPSQTGILAQSQYIGPHQVSFSYWQDPAGDGTALHLSPPPWQVFTQHGLDVGAVGWPDMGLEGSRDVAHYLGQNLAHRAWAYYAVAIHRTGGQAPLLGTPNIPFVYGARLLNGRGTVGDFPGFSAEVPNWALSATLAMQTHGVPITYTYITSVHDLAGAGQLAATDPRLQANLAGYNRAFARFFQGLRAAGLTPANTLIVVTSDEGDHYVPGGEITTGLPAWFHRVGFPDTSSTRIGATAGALVYESGPVARDYPRLDGVPGWRYIDQGPALKALHQYVPKDPGRTPTFILYAEPTIWYDSGSSTALSSGGGYYWNHGMVSRAVNTVFMGLAGPGIRHGGFAPDWIDSTDLMPTVQYLTLKQVEPGLDGNVLFSALSSTARHGVSGSVTRLSALASAWRAINAPVDTFGIDALRISTQAALDMNSARGPALNAALAKLVTERNQQSATMQTMLWQAENGHAIHHVSQAIQNAQTLVRAIGALATQAMIR